MKFYDHHFETDYYNILKCCHHSHYGTVHLYAKFDVDIIFLHTLMNFQCQNTCSGRIQSIKVGALDATANSL